MRSVDVFQLSERCSNTLAFVYVLPRKGAASRKHAGRRNPGSVKVVSPGYQRLS